MLLRSEVRRRELRGPDATTTLEQRRESARRNGSRCVGLEERSHLKRECILEACFVSAERFLEFGIVCVRGQRGDSIGGHGSVFRRGLLRRGQRERRRCRPRTEVAQGLGRACFCLAEFEVRELAACVLSPRARHVFVTRT